MAGHVCNFCNQAEMHGCGLSSFEMPMLLPTGAEHGI